MGYETILYQEDGPIGTLTLNRPDDGNMFTPQMCHEVRDCINEVRRETRTRVLVITGGLARLAHDLLLRGYLDGEESHELSQAFGARRKPDPDKFGH